ncbi:MAG: bifunctional glutamate N-acetyltransferase/amino-acid acetyltransferase ArgJ [Oscillospiraceae bacterium]|nr:bifunctional glutamate N-acetyltransferase/amino-acid acetyltransferase ArgJ [Oscillospiraceae bacterium]
MYEIEVFDMSHVFTDVPGGVTAPKGFRASGVHCGIRKNTEKKDLALIVADCECAAAAVYTTNLVQAAPIAVTRRHLLNGRARAILANSGNANACAADGEENALRVCAAAAKELNIPAEDIIVNSTGVIGQRLPIERIEAAMPELAAALDAGHGGADAAARAIMTTDTVKKEIAVTFELGGVNVTLGAIAKGSGMVRPNMATVLVFFTTDCAVSPGLLNDALSDAVKVSLNRVSVDGDTSTNDMAAILASGMAGNKLIGAKNGDYEIFRAALTHTATRLAKELARDGEGATKLVVCRVSGADDEQTAERLSMSVTSSSLVKAAMFGADANWGREMCAMGYAGARFDPSRVSISFSSGNGEVAVCQNGCGLDFDEDKAKLVLSGKEILIDISIGRGTASAETYGCDLTYDYVRINGEYRS